jgi:hypothetical protein
VVGFHPNQLVRVTNLVDSAQRISKAYNRDLQTFNELPERRLIISHGALLLRPGGAGFDRSGTILRQLTQARREDQPILQQLLYQN